MPPSVHPHTHKHTHTHTGAKNITAKVILDKLFFTPPFLAVTLFTLRLLESGKAGAAWAGTKSVYVPTLKTNLKVCMCVCVCVCSSINPGSRPFFPPSHPTSKIK